MDTIASEIINDDLDALPLWPWANVPQQSAVRLSGWAVNERLEVVQVICEVRP